MTSGMHDYLVPTLKKYGISVYISDASSVKGVIDEITDMGKITGHTKEAAAVTGHIVSVLAGVKSRTGTRTAPSVYWEIWKSPYMSVGNTSFMNDLINNAGGVNIFSSIGQAYPLVSEESVIARNPSVIIIPDMEHETADSVSHRPGWNIIDAVKTGRITVVDSDVTSRPGPRIADAVLLLAKAIHPGLSFDDIR
jgi:iron complex transport system substrate-binding protein